MARTSTRGDSAQHLRPRGKALTEFRKFNVLVQEWHQINYWGPECFGPSSQEKVWWQCSLTREKHSFLATITSRTQAITKGSPFRGCRVCNPKIREQPSRPLSKGLASEWLENINRYPARYLATRSSMLGKWQCRTCAHQWRTKVSARTGEEPQGCPKCHAHCHPDSAIDLRKHRKARELFDAGRDRRNAGYDLRRLPALYKVFWQCTIDPKHRWFESFTALKERKFLCPRCSTYLSDFPQLAKQYPPELNGFINAENLSIETNSKRLITWRCWKGFDHIWQARLVDRLQRADGCPFCRGRRASHTNSLAKLHPDLACQLHPDRNGDLTAWTLPPNSTKKVHWLGTCGHEWQTQVRVRTQRGYGCPKCKRRKQKEQSPKL